jgi:hypothetical protein
MKKKKKKKKKILLLVLYIGTRACLLEYPARRHDGANLISLNFEMSSQEFEMIPRDALSRI